MGELSDRFAALMAGMAKSDAALYRTISEQNTHIRQMVDELVPAEENSTTAARTALQAAALLPAAECDQAPLKKRFKKAAEAQAWIESQIGPAPKKPTWAVIVQTCKTGSWPAKTTPTRRSKALTADELDARLIAFERRLDQRLERIEAMLLLVADSNTALPSASDGR
ncbi:hypothetical protein [Synechococcus sp. UW140]|uniref:hypothetical protein n=1 Tax=Synechococcus sp. UW140 TaxID=368503 RepID=UPI000E0EBF2F|nr:hypothetical protein [Synechococcus sp. UW140]